MRLLVCGSRNWTDRIELRFALSHLACVVKVDCIIEGEQRGADLLAREWGEDAGFPVLPFPADWKRLGKRAGSTRNRRMLLEGKPDAVLAFPLPGSVGTWDMVRVAREAGVKVWVWPECMAEIDALGEGVFV